MTDTKIHPHLQLLIKMVIKEKDIQLALERLELADNTLAREYLDCLILSNLVISLTQSIDDEKLKNLALLLHTKALNQEDLSNWFRLNAPEQIPILLEIGERVLFSLS